MVRAALLSSVLRAVHGHGQLTLPPSRNGGTLATAGECIGGACFWFSQFAYITGEPTNNDEHFRTYNVKVSSGPQDWSRRSPWRAPGSAVVYGSGCGLAGGNATSIMNGGISPTGIAQGADALDVLPKLSTNTVWQRGSTVEVAHAIHCNHGGGYSYRLCRNDGGAVSEECFQQGSLKFAGDNSWLQYDDKIYKGRNIPRQEIRNDRLNKGTWPEGSDWKRIPTPACNFCDAADCSGEYLSLDWERCAAGCAGHSTPVGCPAGLTQFQEPLPGVSGWPGDFGHNGDNTSGTPFTNDKQGDFFPFSVVDEVVLPDDLAPGEYLLSWRWDCEQSPQIWLNCADVTIVSGDAVV